MSNLHIVAVVGSLRRGSHTRKALEIALDEVRRHGEVTVDVIDPAELPLALPGQAGAPDLQEILLRRLQPATGVILSTPEYHGSYSSVLKLLIDNMGYPSVLAGKHVALLGVAAGSIGAVKSLEHLRGVCAHVGAVVLPFPVSVANVDVVFDSAGRCQDAAVERQIRTVAARLMEYIRHHVLPPWSLEAALKAEADDGGAIL
ncbi:MAG: NAD(P)H-dependent oxidoreductase [Candidatus Hydrogenedentes bacterium]|nr:NAD(P)H-dependent oxidoreductase [Candidatus Hydrogenedentota bacterium]